MAWNNKIELAINLISEVAMDDGISEIDAENLCNALDALKKYVDETDFVGMDPVERDSEAACIIGNAVLLCCPVLDRLRNKSCSATKMSRSEALKMLKDEYSKALETGDDELLGMNINEWIERRGIELVDDASDCPCDGG